MRQIRLSDAAINGFASITDYLEWKFDHKTALAYRDSVLTTLDRIAVIPLSNPLLNAKKDKNLYKCVFRKKTIILYRLTDGWIEVEAIRDARSDWQSKL